MISSILLLSSLTSCFWGSFATPTYQAEENHNISMEWSFPVITNRPLNSYMIYCEMIAGEKPAVLFHLHKGVEVPEAQNEQFKGRVRCDKDVLRDGRVRLHLSRLGIHDSGVYVCQVVIELDVSFSEHRLNVTAAERYRPDAEGTGAARWGWIGLYCILGLIAAAVLAVSFLLFIYVRRKRRRQQLSSCDGFKRIQKGSVETVESLA